MGAVRKNVAAAYGSEALRDSDPDVWETMFTIGRTKRSSEQNDLVPFWLFPGEARIERHVPTIPLSREVERLHDLRHALAIYRMVFGQSRQENLIACILTEIPDRPPGARVGVKNGSEAKGSTIGSLMAVNVVFIGFDKGVTTLRTAALGMDGMEAKLLIFR